MLEGLGAGLAGVAGAIGSAMFQAHSARGLSRRQREWQEMMASTAYQRAVADMQAAGLNPALAYQQGGAQTPSGGLSSGVSMENPISSARDAMRARAEIKNLESQNRKIDAEASLAESQIPIAAAQVQNLMSSASLAQAQTAAVEHTVKHTLAQIDYTKSLDEQTREGTVLIRQNQGLNVAQKEMAIQLMAAQIYQARETGRHQGRLADQPVVGGGSYGAIINSAAAVLDAITNRISGMGFKPPPKPKRTDGGSRLRDRGFDIFYDERN